MPQRIRGKRRIELKKEMTRKKGIEKRRGRGEELIREKQKDEVTIPG